MNCFPENFEVYLLLIFAICFILLSIPIHAEDTFLSIRQKSIYSDWLNPGNNKNLFIGTANISCSSIYGSITNLCNFNSSNITIVNDSYVLKSGDNMTGNLLVNQSPNQILLGYESNIGGQTIETIYNDGLNVFSSGFYIIGDGSTSFFSCTASSCTNSFVLEPATSSIQFIGTLYDSSGSGSLGSAGSPWSSLYLSTAAGKGIGTSANPTTDSSLDLGSTTRRWRALYLGNTGLISNGTIRPQTTNNIDLGSSAFRFRDLYANRISYFNITNATTTNTSNLEVKNNTQFNGSVNFLNNTMFKIPANANFTDTNYSINLNNLSRTCSQTWGQLCNSTTLDDANFLGCNGTESGNPNFYPYVSEIYINATNFLPNSGINVTCRFKETAGGNNYEYIWYYNTTDWINIQNWTVDNDGIVNKSFAFNVNSSEGTHRVRCIISFNSETTGECSNSTYTSATKYDTDDVNFTVNSTVQWYNYTLTTNNLPSCDSALRGNMLREEDDSAGDKLYICEYNSTDYGWREI